MCIYIYIGAGFKSKSDYGSGLFHIRMKIPNQKTGGIVPNFYVRFMIQETYYLSF